MSTTTVSQVGLSAAEVAVLRPVFAWARAHGWQRGGPWSPTWVNDELAVDLDHDPSPAVKIRRRSPGRWADASDWLPVSSVAQAVDVLAAYGVLPVQVTSGYRVALAGLESPEVPA